MGLDSSHQVNMFIMLYSKPADESKPVKVLASGQSYKHFMIVIYNPRVIIWGVFKSGTSLES